jgi:integrase
MKPLTRADRNRVFAALQEWSDREKLVNGSRRSDGARLVGLRTRALISLAADSGLRVNECVGLDLAQLLHDTDTRAVRIVSQFWLRANQAKRGSSGMVVVSERARVALRLYILELRRLEWAPWPPAPHTPLFISHRGRRGKPGHNRLSKRSAQWSWHQIQRRAGLVDVAEDGASVKARYGFHSLRHDAVNRIRGAGADVVDLQVQMRWRDLRMATRYVSQIDAQKRIGRLMKKAAKG